MVSVLSDSQVAFNGVKFTKDNRTGYYLSTIAIEDGRRTRLHRYIWQYYNGPIPEGYDIHHKDRDKGNNNVDNLTIMRGNKHKQMHSIEAKNTPEWLEIWEGIRQKGSDAHKRTEERLKQSQRSKEQWAKRKKDVKPSVIKCVICGGRKETYYPDRTMYCSKNCKAKGFRRKFKSEHGYGYHRNYPSSKYAGDDSDG